MRAFSLIIVSAAASFVLAVPVEAQSPMFSVKALPTLEGATRETAYAIDNRGVAIGIIQGGTKCPTECVVAWVNGEVTPQDAPQGATKYVGTIGLSRNGTAVATAVINGVNQAVAWFSDVPTLLPAPDSQHTATVANGVNDSSQVVGSASDSAGDTIAVIWDVTTPLTLETPSGATSAYAEGINDSGLVVGYVCCTSTQKKNEATVWHGTTPALLAKSAPAGGAMGEATAVNESGVAVGIANDSGVVDHAVAWSNKSIISLVSGRSYASAINSHGIIVGQMLSGEQPLAVVWGNDASAPQDLNSLISATAASEIELTSAAGINDNCVIVANGHVKSSGAIKAFVLTINDSDNCVNGLAPKTGF